MRIKGIAENFCNECGFECITGEDVSKILDEYTKRNNLKVEIQNINATLTLARNFSYGKADIVVKNETNQQLNLLVIDLTYGETTTQITFSNVPKKQEQTQAFMMIGPDCDYMDTLPKMEVKTCKLGKLSDEACKNRVQLTPLQ